MQSPSKNRTFAYSAKRGMILNILKRSHVKLISFISESSRLYRFLYFLGLKVSEKERLKKRNLLEFIIPLTLHCNLNCKGCIMHAPISEPCFYAFDKIKSDIGRISEIVEHQVDCLYISGGEPLLHPDIIGVIKFCRECFPEGLIKIYTNGTLLPMQGDIFWKTCHDCNIIIWITHYPIDIKINDIKKKATDFDVVLSWIDFNGDNKKTMGKIPYDLSGKQDPKESFRLCRMANKCSSVWDGKFWPCMVTSTITSFNKYFKKDLKVSESDCLIISEIKDKDEIFEFICHPVAFCRYCNIKSTVFGMPWSVSKKDISEWT